MRAGFLFFFGGLFLGNQGEQADEADGGGDDAEEEDYVCVFANEIAHESSEHDVSAGADDLTLPCREGEDPDDCGGQSADAQEDDEQRQTGGRAFWADGSWAAEAASAGASFIR